MADPDGETESLEKAIEDLAKQDRQNRRPAPLRPWVCYWPPLIAIVPASIAQIIWGDTPRFVIRTHGYFEIAAVIAYGGAFVCALKLSRHRKKLIYAIPFYLNLLFLMTPGIMLAVMILFDIDQL